MVESSCAVPFTRGKTYLVYASRMGDSDFLQANACGRTGALTSAGNDLEALGAPIDQLSDTGGPDIHLFAAMVAGTTAFVLLVTTLASFLRQRS